MAETNWRTRLGITPVKGAVVAGLAIILVIVCVLQFTGDEPALRRRAATARARQNNASRTPARHGPAQHRPTAEPTRTVNAAPWPRMKLDTILQYDPFQMPRRVAMKIHADAAKKQRETERLHMLANEQLQASAGQAKALSELQQAGVQLIVSGGGRVVAWVGNQPVQVGDNLYGLTVVEIRPDGIVLTRKQQ